MGKWAKSPKTRINRGFFRGHFHFQKWAESGQMARNIHDFGDEKGFFGIKNRHFKTKNGQKPTFEI